MNQLSADNTVMKTASWHAIALPLLLIGLQTASSAQTAPDAATATLLKKVESLENSLAIVKAELAQRGLISTVSPAPVVTSAPSPTATAAVAPILDAESAAILAADNTTHDNHTLGPLSFRGYSDFGFGRPLFEKRPEGGLRGSTNSFTLGDFDLFVSAQISDRISVLGEALITSDFSNSFGAEMDRLLLTYSYNKYFNISAGKYNTSIGFYTNAFHRARYFQTATSRPILFSDEDNGGILPVHSIGLSATGEVPSGKLGLHWVAEIANGRTSHDQTLSAIQNFVDENNGKAFNVALFARPAFAHGVDVGVSLYRDRLHPAGRADMEQRIYSAHAALIRPHLELIGEGVLLQHTFLHGNSFNTLSSYAQASYQIHQIRPYVRYEYQNVPASDPILGTLGRQNGPSVGARYEFSDFGNFKLQFGRLSLRDGTSTNAVSAQLAFAF